MPLHYYILDRTPIRGDHIRATMTPWLPVFMYHHGIYIGDGRVVHLDRPSHLANHLGIGPYEIISTPLSEFTTDLHKIEVLKDGRYQELDKEQVARNAEKRVGEKGNYSLTGALTLPKIFLGKSEKFINCEHFARYCSTGVSSSDQATFAGDLLMLGLWIGGIVIYEQVKKNREE